MVILTVVVGEMPLKIHLSGVSICFRFHHSTRDMVKHHNILKAAIIVELRVCILI